MAKIKEVYPATTVNISIRKAIPDSIVNGTAVKGKPAVRYTFKKLAGASAPYPIEAVFEQIKKICSDIKLDEVEKAIEIAVNSPRIPLYTKEDYIKIFKGNEMAEASSKIESLTEEVENLKKELAKRK